MGLLDDARQFFTREAGQERRKWLDENLQDAGGLLNHYLGPTGVPDKLQAAGGLLNYTDAGDMTEAADASREFWNDPSFRGGVRLGTAGAAMAIPFVGARMLNDGVDVMGDALRSGGDDVSRFAADESGAVGPGAGLSPAQQQAQDVLGLLQSGRGADVTDDMLAAADDMYLYDNYDLPMDEASRMARAQDMGFDVDAYHGTYGDNFDRFDPKFGDSRRKTGTPQGAHVFTDDPLNADTYSGKNNGLDYSREHKDGGRIIPVKTRGSINEYADVQGEMTADRFFDFFEAELGSGGEWAGHINDLARQSQSDGFDRLRVDGVVDSAGGYNSPQTTSFIFDPANIRSRFARFDPRLSHLRNLSAGIGGLGLLYGMPQQNDREGF